MEFKLKAISAEGIDAALAKAEVYRFLNEPEEAESICQDVLAVQPGHQLALRTLGLEGLIEPGRLRAAMVNCRSAGDESPCQQSFIGIHRRLELRHQRLLRIHILLRDGLLCQQGRVARQDRADIGQLGLIQRHVVTGLTAGAVKG